METQETTEETALAVVEATPIIHTRRAIILKDALEEATEQRALLVRYVKTHMREDVDFGTIPGTPKPSLWKAGAEKLTELYRCTPQFRIAEKTLDWERGFFHYTFRCKLISRDSGAVLAEGFGSCSSFESKYRWRDGKRKCPNCAKETIFKSKNGPGWYCWEKKGGCGQQWRNDQEPSIVGQVIGKVENPDMADVLNTVLKMAKKRAHVDGAIALAGCSDLFTQDLEDLHDAHPEPAPQPQPDRAKSRAHAVAQEMRAKPGPVVDVRSGETEEEATQRAGRPFAGLTDADLSSQIDAFRKRLEDAPVGTPRHAGLKNHLEGLETELGARLPG